MILKEIAEIFDCEHKTAPIQGGGIPSVRTPNVGKGRLILDGVNRVSEETYKKWSRRAIPQENDLILAREAPVGNVAIIQKGQKVCLGQRTVLIRPNKDTINPHYLTYLLLGDEIQGVFHGVSSGATVAHLNVGDIRKLKLPVLPPLLTQKRIADILSAYDDLLENNNRRIKILEEMAQNLYREWFVKFCFPIYRSDGTLERIHNPETDQMKDSVMGKIPVGWKVKKLFDISNPTYGYAFKSKLFNDDNKGIPVIRIRDILNNKSKTYTLETPKKESQIIKNGDLLIGMDGNFHMGKWAGGHAFLCQRVVKITPSSDNIGAYLLFNLFKQPIINLNKSIVGTTVAHLGDKHLKEVNVLIPDKYLLREVNSKLNPLFSKEINLHIKNSNLSKTRNLLLPKLISGEIEV